MPNKSFLYGPVRFKGGQPCFSKIPNWPSLKLHNFFDFNSNNKSVKIPAKLTTFFHPAKFWNPRPEISVCPKNFVFPPLGDLPPFVFAENDSIQKKFFFYLRYVNVYYNRRKKLWCNSSWLQNFCKWSPRWCHFFTKNYLKKIYCRT